MLSKEIEKSLNDQLKIEAVSSHYYLAMASWAENKGYPGIADFMYQHSDEERMHMLKLVRYINERGGVAQIPSMEKPELDFVNPVLFIGELNFESNKKLEYKLPLKFKF